MYGLNTTPINGTSTGVTLLIETSDESFGVGFRMRGKILIDFIARQLLSDLYIYTVLPQGMNSTSSEKTRSQASGTEVSNDSFHFTRGINTQ